MDKNLEKKVSVSGIVAIIVLFALYAVSCFVDTSWQIHTDDFWGPAELILVSFAVSVIWLALYWFLDRIKHESVTATFTTFFLGVAAYILGKVISNWLLGDEAPPFIDNMVLPLFSFYFVFVFFVTKSESFDELVDSFIYGGFTGTGIAFSSCIMGFMTWHTFDGQFVIVSLITRISVYAAICSLSGFMVHQALLKKKTLRLVLSLVIAALLFVLNSIAEQVLEGSLRFSSSEFIQVLIAAAFALALVSVVVIRIHLILKKDSEDSDFRIAEPLKSVFVIAAVFVVFFFGIELFLRHQLFRTEKFVSPDGKWTYSLPSEYYEEYAETEGSVFNLSASESTGPVFYMTQSGPINLYFYFDAEIDENQLLYMQDVEYGWQQSSVVNQFVENDRFGNPYIVYQQTFFLKKGETTVLADTYSDKKFDVEVERALRLFMKTLEANK